LVYVVAGEGQYGVWTLPIDDIEMLVNRVGGAAIPKFTQLLLRRHDVDELAELAVQITPAALNMLNQRVRLILGQDEDLANTRVHAVRQREIDDAVLAAEWRGGFGAVVGELHETLSPPSRHDDCQS